MTKEERKEVEDWVRSYIGEDATDEQVQQSIRVLGDFLENLLAIQERIDREAREGQLEGSA